MDGGRPAVRGTSRARGAEFMIVALLIVHGLLAVALLGAITHQAWSVVPRPAGAGALSFAGRFRSVDSGAYATAVVVLFVVTAIGGGPLFPPYCPPARAAPPEPPVAAPPRGLRS